MSISMSCDSREDAAKRRIAAGCIGGKTQTYQCHSVTFQPRGATANQDRMVMDRWEIHGQEWLFLAVFDGHLGPTTSDYTSKTLPTVIQRQLCAYIGSIGGRLGRENLTRYELQVTDLLKNEIERFDQAIGDALRGVCPRPWELSEEQARQLIKDHQDVVLQAFSGTTLAFALINPHERFMWAAGLGDSSVGLCTKNRNGKTRAFRLCDIHSFHDPKEYFRAVMSHPTSEKGDLFDWENRILGWMAVPRSIGGFALKLQAAYLDHLFRYMGFNGDPPIETHIPKIKTPPYVLSEPSVRFTDLQPYWGRNSKLFLFTDGVDNLVDGWLVFKPREHSRANPVEVVGELLSHNIGPKIEIILGHAVVPGWSGDEANRALDVLGNLLGGTDVERLEMVTNTDIIDDPDADWPFHIDDTTIIVFPLRDA